jgi:hypothetical protein
MIMTEAINLAKMNLAANSSRAKEALEMARQLQATEVLKMKPSALRMVREMNLTANSSKVREALETTSQFSAPTARDLEMMTSAAQMVRDWFESPTGQQFVKDVEAEARRDQFLSTTYIHHYCPHRND